MKVRVFIAALLTAAALFISRPSSAIAAPALYVAKGPAGKVYRFGTVHLLRDGVQWRSPELQVAMRDSQDLYLEIADANNAPAALTSMMRAGLDRNHPLSTKISKADVALLDAVAKRYGLSGEVMFEPMQPWFAFMMLSALPSMHAGATSANGVDLQIRKAFVAAGKPIRGFETFDMQAHIFADMPQATQIALLDYQLKNIGKQPDGAQLDTIVNAWLSGNEATLAATLHLDKTAEIVAALLTNRNKAWAIALAGRLKQPGTSFVAVGAAHLAGADGVPSLLQKMGFEVSRVPIADVPATSSPSPGPSESASPTASASATASASPSALASPTASPSATPPPKPAAITPPSGWKSQSVSLATGQVKVDRMWLDPLRRGVIITAHLDVEGLNGVGLDALDTFIHQGMVAAAGADAVGSSKRVKICNGKQDALYTTITLKNVKEETVVTLADRAYMAQYVRRKDVPVDAAAMKALMSMCAP